MPYKPRRSGWTTIRVTNQIPFRVHPMLAMLVAEPFDRPGWVFEEQYDGDRILAYKEEDGVRLLSRNERDLPDGFLQY
jgi:ATP-dependent DNA ligase